MKTTLFSPPDMPSHTPVMLEESVAFLRPGPGKIYVDATIGAGGHSEAILSSAGEGARLIGIDSDPDAVRFAGRRLRRFGDCVSIVNANFAGIEEAVRDLGVRKVDGIIADLGISSRQLSGSGRGFSFNADEPLDMRMNPALETTAAHIVNTMTAREIEEIIKKYGEEKFARQIAAAIVKKRKEKPVSTSHSLALLVSGAIPSKFYPPRAHPATRTFQALRIQVNSEIENLEIFMKKAPPLLKKGARIAVISFHSLEDRVVKRAFKLMGSGCICPPAMPRCGCGKKKILEVITRRPVRPSPEEIMKNPRARSSRIRVAEKV